MLFKKNIHFQHFIVIMQSAVLNLHWYKGAVINYDREGGGSLAAGVWNFFQQICRGMKLLINIWLGSQTDFQLKEHVQAGFLFKLSIN